MSVGLSYIIHTSSCSTRVINEGITMCVIPKRPTDIMNRRSCCDVEERNFFRGAPTT